MAAETLGRSRKPGGGGGGGEAAAGSTAPPPAAAPAGVSVACGRTCSAIGPAYLQHKRAPGFKNAWRIDRARARASLRDWGARAPCGAHRLSAGVRCQHTHRPQPTAGLRGSADAQQRVVRRAAAAAAGRVSTQADIFFRFVLRAAAADRAEEALDLAAVQVDADHPVDLRGGPAAETAASGSLRH